MQKTIFVVDDNDTNLSTAKEALKKQYRVITLPSAIKMFAYLEKVVPELILLDIEMPGMDGFEALHLLKANSSHSNIPVIFLTSTTDSTVEARGFQMGVVDFITKPFSERVLLNRIKTHLDIDELIRERTVQLQRLQNGIVFVLSDMVENRDKGTGGHIERTASYLKVLVKSMITRGVCVDEIPRMDIELLASSSRLHDIGKISISDTILNKPGKLNDEEFEVMKTHAAEGERIINQMISRTEDQEFLLSAKLFAGYHHEHWDGSGYPRKLAGRNIPFQGRLMAVVDVYDALVSMRPYKRSFTHEEANKIIMESAGKQFDPCIVEIYSEVEPQFAEVSRVGKTNSNVEKTGAQA
jgi:putative two-component system response regulator